jgi:hypothetical protein
MASVRSSFVVLFFVLQAQHGGASFFSLLFKNPSAVPTGSPTASPTILPTAKPTTFEGGAIDHLHTVGSEIEKGLRSSIKRHKGLVDITLRQAAQSLNKQYNRTLVKMDNVANKLETTMKLAPGNLSVASQQLKVYAADVQERLYKGCAASSSLSHELAQPNPQLTVGNFSCNLQSLKQNAQYVAGTSVIAACAVSFSHVMALLCSTEQPQFRKYFIRIVLMVPVYAVNAYYALKRPHLSFIYGLARCAYEAFVLYSFVQFLLTAVGGPAKLARTLRRQQIETHRKETAKAGAAESAEGLDGGSMDDMSAEVHNSGDSARFVRCTLLGTLQYIPAMGVVITLSYWSNMKGQYQEGEFDTHNMWVWCR